MSVILNMNRFGTSSDENIKNSVKNSISKNTIACKTSIWRQFKCFCDEKNYVLSSTTPIAEIATILRSWAFNMRKTNGEDYKEYVVKTLWNSTAKMVQEKYFYEFNVAFDPFKDLAFKEARDARDAKRKELQIIPEKRKLSSVALTKSDIMKMAKLWNENLPNEIQKKFYHIAAFEQAWRGGEAADCRVHYFKEEYDNHGCITGRMEYNPIFSKTCQGGSKKLSDSKWLAPNTVDEDICLVRLLKKILKKRGTHITSDRLFLTPNPFWKLEGSKGWFKNVPLGKQTISKWTQNSASSIGININEYKITNHSHRAATVTELSKSGVSDQQLIKITGHSNANSIKPYLQLDSNHHSNLINNLREENEVSFSSKTITVEEENKDRVMTFNNCTFNNCSFKDNL